MKLGFRIYVVLTSICVATVANGQNLMPGQTLDGKRPNILLLIGDDMGNETLSCYGWSKNPAKTPTLDDLCASGVRFDNFWSQPICSPTRATMLTGRYGFRTGVGRPTGDRETMGYFPDPPPKPASAPAEPARGQGGRPNRENAPQDWGLPMTEFALPMAFKVNQDLGYATAAIGKWHLADNRNGWQDHPNLVGFDHFAGLIRGFPDSFFTWNQVVNGELTGQTGYTPDVKTRDAIEWIEQQGDRPWFLWMAYNLIHTPLHLPSEDLWRGDWSDVDPQTNPRSDGLAYGNMLLEALDVQIERLLDSMPDDVRDNTYVIFLGDNGSSRGSVRPPVAPNKAKGSLYQGGVNVPLMIAGPGVKPGVSKALVNSTDLYATIMEMAGIDVAHTVPQHVPTDSVSVMPYLENPDAESIRDFAYADVFAGNHAGVEAGDYAIRGEQYKLYRRRGNFEFYDLAADPFEENNLMQNELDTEAQSAHDWLLARATELRASGVTQ